MNSSPDYTADRLRALLPFTTDPEYGSLLAPRVDEVMVGRSQPDYSSSGGEFVAQIMDIRDALKDTSSLTAKERVAVQLVLVQDHSNNDAAAAEGVDASTMSKRVASAESKLLAHLNGPANK